MDQFIQNIKENLIIFELKHCEYDEGVLCKLIENKNGMIITSKKFEIGVGMCIYTKNILNNRHVLENYSILQKSSDKLLNYLLSQTIGKYSRYYKNSVNKINILNIIYCSKNEKTNVLYNFPTELIRELKSFLL